MKRNGFAPLALSLLITLFFVSCGGNDDEIPFDEGFKGKVATYTISGNNITLTKDWGSSSTFYANSTNQLELWNFYANLIPSDLRPQLIKLELFADKDDDTGAYVSPISDNDLSKWELGYNMAYAWSSTFQLNKSDVAFNSIHEYAHVLTLNNTQLVAGGSEDTCASYFPGEGCSREAAYINQFFTNYWTDIFDESQAFDEDDDEAFFAFYDKYADRFVSEYASTNPEEDIAESFARFVLLDQPTGNQIKDQKVRFFYDYQELIVIRDQIRANVDFNFNINDVGGARLNGLNARSRQPHTSKVF
jgi:hypothetical protein